MKFLDRLLTIVITATLTSAIWIVFGATLMESVPGGEESAGAIAQGEGSGPDSDAPDPVPGATPALPATRPAPKPTAPPPTAAPVKTALIIPVEGVASVGLTDSFLDPRGENGVRRHEAIDIMAPKGTAVIAAAAGEIAKIYNSKDGGKSVYVRSRDKRTLYFYAHLDSYAKGLKEGRDIKAGDVLGSVGSTGNAQPDAPHLHFAVLQTTRDAEWWEPANAVNPYPLLTEPVQ